MAGDIKVNRLDALGLRHQFRSFSKRTAQVSSFWTAYYTERFNSDIICSRKVQMHTHDFNVTWDSVNCNGTQLHGYLTITSSIFCDWLIFCDFVKLALLTMPQPYLKQNIPLVMDKATSLLGESRRRILRTKKNSR